MTTINSLTSDTPTILAISDGEFLPHLRALITSVNSNFPQAHLHIYLVNVTQPEEQVLLKQLHPNVEFTCVEKLLDHERVKIALDAKTKFTEKAGFCVNLRVSAILDLLHQDVDNILFVDADTIIRKDLSRLFKQLKSHEILIHKRPNEKPFMRVAGGVIGVRNTRWTKNFFSRFLEHVNNLGNKEFFSDQWGFSLTMQELNADSRIGHLAKSYIDWDFDADSFIWVGKGQRKYKNAEYLAEKSNYESIN